MHDTSLETFCKHLLEILFQAIRQKHNGVAKYLLTSITTELSTYILQKDVCGRTAFMDVSFFSSFLIKKEGTFHKRKPSFSVQAAITGNADMIETLAHYGVEGTDINGWNALMHVIVSLQFVCLLTM